MTERKRFIKTTTTAQRRRFQVASLLSQPEVPTIPEMSALVGATERTIERIARDVMPDIADLERKKAEYRKALGDLLPIEKRSRRYAELVSQKKHPIAALKALVRVDELDGIITRRDEGEQRSPVPMFSLPPGSKVAIAVGPETSCTCAQEYTQGCPIHGVSICGSRPAKTPPTPPNRSPK